MDTARGRWAVALALPFVLWGAAQFLALQVLWHRLGPGPSLATTGVIAAAASGAGALVLARRCSPPARFAAWVAWVIATAAGAS